MHMQPETFSPKTVDAAYWSIPADTLLTGLESRADGLSSEEAKARLAAFGDNTIHARRGSSAVAAFLRQFRSPLVLILIFAAGVSAVVGEGSEAAIIAVIVLASCILSFTQEHGASRAMEALTARIGRKALVLRDGRETPIPVEEVVPGDIVRLSAGNPSRPTASCWRRASSMSARRR